MRKTWCLSIVHFSGNYFVITLLQLGGVTKLLSHPCGVSTHNVIQSHLVTTIGQNVVYHILYLLGIYGETRVRLVQCVRLARPCVRA